MVLPPEEERRQGDRPQPEEQGRMPGAGNTSSTLYCMLEVRLVATMMAYLEFDHALSQRTDIPLCPGSPLLIFLYVQDVHY